MQVMGIWLNLDEKCGKCNLKKNKKTRKENATMCICNEKVRGIFFKKNENEKLALPDKIKALSLPMRAG